MKNTALDVSLAIALCLGAASAFAAGGQKWYCTDADTTKNNYSFKDPSYWHLADGTVMTEFSEEDEYFLQNVNTYISQAPTFPGGTLHIGNLADGKSVAILIYSGNFPTHGVVLEKGRIACNRSSMPSAHTLSGAVNVVSPASAPFVVGYNYGSTTFHVTGAVTGEADAALQFAGGAKTGVGVVFTDVSGYKGLLTATSTVENTSSATGFTLSFRGTSFPGSLDMSGGTVLQMHSSVAGSAMTVSNMTFRSGARIVVGGTAAAHGSFVATGSVSVEPGVEIFLNFAVPISTQTNTLVLLSAPADDANFSKDDFVLDASKSDWKQHSHLDTVVEDGVKSLVAVFEPLVKQTGAYPYEYEFKNNEEHRASSMTNAAYWSDELVPHGGAHYWTETNLRTPYNPSATEVFPGLSLTLDGAALRIFHSDYTVTNLIVNGGTIQTCGGSGEADKLLHSKMITVKEGKTLAFETHLGNGIDIDAEISGGGRLWFSGIKRSAGTSSPSAHYMLRKMNEDFLGTVCVSQFIKEAGYISFASKFQTLRIAHGKCLGGRLPEFNPAALTLANYSRLQTIASKVELEDGLNRGVYIQGCGRFYVNETDGVADTLVCNWPITMNGALHKEGAGRLDLGGAASFQGEDAIGDTPRANSNLFFVSAGSLAPRRHDCCDGMAVSFASGTKLVIPVDPQKADLTKYGLYDVKEGGGVSIAGTLAVEFDTSAAPVPPSHDFTVGIVTVTNTAAAVEAVRGRLKLGARPYEGYRATVVEMPDTERDVVVFSARIKRCGFSISIR